MGKGIKWASIRNLVRKHKIDLLCLQETKRDSIDKNVKTKCKTLVAQKNAWDYVMEA